VSTAAAVWWATVGMPEGIGRSVVGPAKVAGKYSPMAVGPSSFRRTVLE